MGLSVLLKQMPSVGGEREMKIVEINEHSTLNAFMVVLLRVEG